ncbi:PepSY domain-containing protein [Olivibacter sp. SDN3]|uniref:PepSY-associated TM helix domain-containing protein n=1 Tax=Olivibacter sp. SDN3 TaxID=2764720 RepID=UPI00165105B7|nr:PepSY-associated TM helix domain-containing protein [Olivibacter sp. SDN3]QNL49684.1 PepSY domain-containing protein [Olivibacter sp. SDN3]
MNNRNYNIYFHTHTISGIIICALLYVIFFAGSFSFFKDEISAWQSNTSYVKHNEHTFPYHLLLDSLDKKYDLSGRDITLFHYQNTTKSYITVTDSKDTVNNQRAQERANFSYDFVNKEEKTYNQAYDLGEFLYRLHFLAQLNQAFPFPIGYPFGYIVAGLVSFLFLFALITGLLLHWDKLVSNFFLFRPWSKLKTVWTDLHTVLGVIGFPFQFVFAVTGIILIVNTVYITPFSHLLYNGNSEKIFEDLEYATNAVEAEFTNTPLADKPDIQALINRTYQMWPDAFLKWVTIKNYGDENMQLLIEAEADHKHSFSGIGKIIYHVQTNKIIQQKSPYDGSSYISVLKSLIYRLHFGDYGGYFIKIVNFVLGITGCIVIISGIVIWLVARDKNNVPAHKRKFNFWLSNIFLAICLSMFPVTAFTFITVKTSSQVDQTFIYQIYFYSWLILSLYYICRKNLNRTNRETLLLGSLLSFGVPIANGIFSDNWFWNTFSSGATDILFLDLFWLSIAVVTLISYFKIRQRKIDS